MKTTFSRWPSFWSAIETALLIPPHSTIALLSWMNRVADWIEGSGWVSLSAT